MAQSGYALGHFHFQRAMRWTLPGRVVMRDERHFGERVVRCFAERPASIFESLIGACRARPQAEALVCGDERLSYARLAERAAAMAAGLATRGVRQGDRVALRLGNRVEFATALLGILHLGAIAVPVGTRLQKPEVEYIVGQCGAKLLLDDATVGGLEKRGDAPPVARVAEEDTAIILYTSGTTGRPKGAMLTHFNVVHSLLHFQHCMALGPQDRTLLAVPASHVTGVVALMLTAWNAHGALVLMPEFKARAYLELAARERITYTVLVPAMYKLCLLDPQFDSFDLSAWRVGGYGGAPMPQATIAELSAKCPGLALMNAYGATETTSPATIMPAAHTAGRSDSVGLAVPCGEIKVVAADGREVAAGQPGELWISGPMVVPGYWDNPEATAQSFTEGYWRSGDVGSRDADGFVRVFDRLKDMINRGGYKIFSVEVENVLSHHPAVVESAIVGRPCPVLGERVHAFVTTRAAVDEAELRRFCAERLADYKVPESFTLLDRPLPRNANGKLLKRELRGSLG
jgi:acyl-CoA synthetase (AMP-forming)/AMP-acid ligase II